MHKYDDYLKIPNIRPLNLKMVIVDMGTLVGSLKKEFLKEKVKDDFYNKITFQDYNWNVIPKINIKK